MVAIRNSLVIAIAEYNSKLQSDRFEASSSQRCRLCQHSRTSHVPMVAIRISLGIAIVLFEAPK